MIQDCRFRMLRRARVRFAKPTVPFLVVALAVLTVSCSSPVQERVSKHGEYRGFSEPLYKEWARSSLYIDVRDGTRLAADIFRPARDGQPAEQAFPVLLTVDRYRRSFEDNGQLFTQVDEDPWLPEMLRHGYVVAAVDSRGSGASFGTRYGPFPPVEVQDNFDVTEWLARQPWCDGNVGMVGVSYRGANQLLAASNPSPHLKAIVPEMAMFDMYHFVRAGGIFRNDFVNRWNELVKLLDVEQPAAPTDDDPERHALAEAIEQHRGNGDVYQIFERLVYRDTIDSITETQVHFVRSPHHYLESIRKSKVPIYHFSGWFDAWPRDALVAFQNLDNPQKIMIGPWSHDQMDWDLWVTEHLRWFDYWLKQIDNGIMDEPPIHYYTMGAPQEQRWRSVSRWPIPEARAKAFYFGAGASGSVQSVNDGTLSTRSTMARAETDAGDDYPVDYTTTTGKTTRWANAYGAEFEYPDMRPNDEKGLTYTTAPLEADVEVTGHPVVHLWVTASEPDADFFVYLEEVDREGRSHYVTEGVLRASHRATHDPPLDYFGLPYHRSYKEDVRDLPSEPVELLIDLHPTSNLFDQGHRIRVTITGADRDNHLTPEQSPPPTLRIHRSEDRASRIRLPIVSAGAASKGASNE